MDETEAEVKTQHTEPMEIPPEEFYGNPNSIYIRVLWSDEEKGFAITVRNELWYKYEQDPTQIPDELVRLSAFVRGMIELGLTYPSNAYTIGTYAINNDLIQRETEGMSDLQKTLLRGEPFGNA